MIIFLKKITFLKIKLNKMPELNSTAFFEVDWTWWYMALTLAFGKQRQTDLCDLEARLLYTIRTCLKKGEGRRRRGEGRERG